MADQNAVTLDWSKASPLAGGAPQSAPAQPSSGGGVQLDWSKATPIVGAAPSSDTPAQPSAIDRFTAGASALPKSLYHGIMDEPQDAGETHAHATAGQGGLIAYRAAKKVMEAHAAMSEAKPGDAFRQAAMDFKNAVIDYTLGNKSDALDHALSGGMSVAGGVEPAAAGSFGDEANMGRVHRHGS